MSLEQAPVPTMIFVLTRLAAFLVLSAISVSRRKTVLVSMSHGEDACSLFERMQAVAFFGGIDSAGLVRPPLEGLEVVTEVVVGVVVRNYVCV